MLTLANIHAGSKVLVFDTCAGLVLGAVMERMGGACVLTFPELTLVLFCDLCIITSASHPGYGSVVQMYPGGGPVRAGVESFGFPPHFHDMLHEFPISHVNALLERTLDTSGKEPSAGNTLLFYLCMW